MMRFPCVSLAVGSAALVILAAGWAGRPFAADAFSAPDSPTVTVRPRTAPGAPNVASRALPAAITLRAADEPVGEVLKRVGEQAGIPIYVEEGLSMRLTVDLTGRSLEDALRVLAGEAGLLWARVDAERRSEAPLPSEPLFALVRGLHALSAARMTVRLGEGNETVTLRREASGPESLVASGSTAVAAAAVSMPPARPVTLYVVAARTPLSPTAPSGTSETAAGAVNPAVIEPQRRYEQLRNLTPEERIQALQQEQYYLLSLPIETRMEMTAMEDEARRQLPMEIQILMKQRMHEVNERLKGPTPEKGGTGVKKGPPEIGGPKKGK